MAIKLEGPAPPDRDSPGPPEPPGGAANGGGPDGAPLGVSPSAVAAAGVDPSIGTGMVAPAAPIAAVGRPAAAMTAWRGSTDEDGAGSVRPAGGVGPMPVAESPSGPAPPPARPTSGATASSTGRPACTTRTPTG